MLIQKILGHLDSYFIPVWIWSGWPNHFFSSEKESNDVGSPQKSCAEGKQNKTKKPIYSSHDLIIER